MHSSDSGSRQGAPSGAGEGPHGFGGARGPYGDTQLGTPLGPGHGETSAASGRDRVAPLCATSDVATRTETAPKPPQNAPGLCAAGSWPGQSCGFPETAGSRLPAGECCVAKRGCGSRRALRGRDGTGWEHAAQEHIQMNPHPGEPTTKGKTPRQGRGTAPLKAPAQPSLPGGCSSPPAPHLQAQCTRDPGSGARATPQPVSTVPKPFSWWNHSPASPRGEQTEMVLHAQRPPASPERGHGEEGATTEVRALVPRSRHGRRCRGLPAAVVGLYKRQAAPSALLHQGCWVRPPPAPVGAGSSRPARAHGKIDELITSMPRSPGSPKANPKANRVPRVLGRGGDAPRLLPRACLGRGLPPRLSPLSPSIPPPRSRAAQPAGKPAGR